MVGLVAAATIAALPTGAAAVGDGQPPPPPPYPAPAAVVTVEWEASDKLVFLYDATTSPAPLTYPHSGEWTGWSGGCTPGSPTYGQRFPLFLGGGARPETGYNWSTAPGTYTITAVSNAWCVDSDEAARAAAAQYPVGRPVRVTARIESYAAGSTTPEVRTVSAEVPVQLAAEEGGRRILGQVTVPAGEGDQAAPGVTPPPAGASSTSGTTAAPTTPTPSEGEDTAQVLIGLILALGLIGLALVATILVVLRGARQVGEPGRRPTTGFSEHGADLAPATLDRPARGWDGDTPLLVPPGDYVAGHSQSGWTQVDVPDEEGRDRWVWVPRQAVRRVPTPPPTSTPSGRAPRRPGLRSGTYRPAETVVRSRLLVRTGENFEPRYLPASLHVLLGAPDPATGLVPVLGLDGELLGWFESEAQAIGHVRLGQEATAPR